MSDISMPSPEAISSMISALRENPALLQGIASSLGIDKGEENKKEDDAPSEAKTQEASSVSPLPPEIMKALPTVLSLMSGEGKAKSQSEANSEALLYALKPYLSQSRADAIEKIIRLSRLGDIRSEIK